MCCKQPGDGLGGLLKPCSDLKNTHVKASSGTGCTRLAGGRPPDSKMASAEAAKSQDGDPQPRLRSQVSSPPPQPGWGWGRASRCRAPVVFHRGGCRRGSLSRAMRLLCWWQVLLWVLGLPALSLEGECGPGRGRRLRGGDSLLLGRPAAVRCGAAGAGGPAGLSGGSVWRWPRQTLIVAVAIRIPELCAMPASWCQSRSVLPPAPGDSFSLAGLTGG